MISESTQLQLEVAMTNMIEGLIKLGVPREALKSKQTNHPYYYNCHIKYTHDFSHAKLDNISIEDYDRTITIETEGNWGRPSGNGGWRIQYYGPSHFVKRPKTLKRHLDAAVEYINRNGLCNTAVEIARNEPFTMLKLYNEYIADGRVRKIPNPGLGKYRTGIEELKKKKK